MLKILQITDLHILGDETGSMYGVVTEFSFRQVIRQAHNRHGPFDLILLTGDLVQDAEVSRYQRIAKILNGYHTPCLCLPGNHDDFAMMQHILKGRYLICRPQLQLVFKNWQIIGLNSQKQHSPAGTLDTDELNFLDTSLKSRPNLPAIIAMHHHCIASHSSWMDTMQIDNSDEFMALLSRYQQVKAVVFGHVHQFLSERVNDMDIIATPSTCFQFKPFASELIIDNQRPAYRVLELYPNTEIKTECFYLFENDQIDTESL